MGPVVAGLGRGGASMKGFPRRGSDTGRCGRWTAGRPCLNEGLPQKGKRWAPGWRPAESRRSLNEGLPQKGKRLAPRAVATAVHPQPQ